MDNNELKKALLAAFAEEAPDILQTIERQLNALETASEEQIADLFNELKRALHSLKGSASAIGNEALRNVCHKLEDVVLEANAALSDELLDKLHEGYLYLQMACEQADQPLDNDDIMALLASDLAKPAASKPAASSKKANTSSEQKPHDKRQTQDNIRVAVSKIDHIHSVVGELVAIRLQQDAELEKLIEQQQATNHLHQLWRKVRSEIYDLRQYLPLNVQGKLDRKAAALSKQIKYTQRQGFLLASQARNQVGQLHLLSDELDMGLRSIRMTSVAPFLASFQSVVRDAAKQLHKKVHLECDDKDIELDRLIIEKLKEPIMHLVRNCISHGIELPEQRAQSGKDEQGLIRMTAALDGDQVVLTIEDDGAGFDYQAIWQKALEQGLIGENSQLSDDQLLNLVALPGFSTAKQVDMVSGRGIGMDVVMTLLAEIGGKLSLSSQAGKGSCFTLRVPSSLATTQGLILSIGPYCFGIAMDMVECIVRHRLKHIETLNDKTVIYNEGEAVSVVSLAAILQLNEHVPNQNDAYYPMVLLRLGKQRLALIIDDIPGEIPLMVKSMGPQFENKALYLGGAILSDGSVLPVLNARFLMSMVSGKVYQASSTQSAMPSEHIAAQGSNTILVVDDSITTRTLERNILEAAGYQVLVATDGIEAFEILTYEENIALLITDLEMPRMDGLALCRKVRASKFAHLPIIMVTSLGSEEEKRCGLEAGADAYVVKNLFQQEEFLALVERFVASE